MINNDFKTTGLDKEMPYLEVLMEKTDTATYPRYELSEGYDFRFYESGMEEAFAKLQYLIGGANSVEAARDIFMREFSDKLELLKERMVYVIAPNGECAGTACLWHGEHPGYLSSRVHWVTVHPAHQNKGLCKALLTRLLDMHNALGLEPYIYLTTQTWSYKAINIYFEFGFKVLKHIKSELSNEPTDNDELAWNLILDKIEQYENVEEKKHGR